MKNLTPFISMIFQDCLSRGVTLFLSPTKCLKTGKDIYKGSWDSDKKQITVASACDNWWMVLGHEWAHMCQPEDPEIDKAYMYMDNKKKSKSKYIHATRIIQRHELDAEKRVVKAIKQYGLPIPENYIQRANAYILSYEAGRRHGLWDMKSSPSDEYEIYSKMPRRFISKNKLGHLSPELETLYLERVFKYEKPI